MADTDDILFERVGGVATVTLNRPQQLNAFTLGMYRRFDPMLREWAADSAIHAVVIQGAEGRAFCAGGDIRAIYEAGRGIAGDPSLTSTFFREEYELIRRIHRYPKPYVAMIDGIAMGGGAGVSVNGAYRIATERAMFAMPETGIGLFPDVGATRFLNLCPGHVGRYLGLTGARLGTADALYCGFATHFVRRERLPALLECAAARHLAQRQRIRAGRGGADGVPHAARDAASGAPRGRNRPQFCRRYRRSRPRLARGRYEIGRRGRRMGGANPRRSADQIADQPQDHAGPADDRARAAISRRR